MRARLCLGLAAALLIGAAPADPLPRSVTLGVAGSPSDGGVKVDRLAPDLAGARLGLREGDVILSLNGRPTADMPALAAAVGTLRARAPVRLAILRGGKQQTLSGPALGRPLEAYRNGTARYGAAPFQGGLLREILVTPAGGAKGPVLFLIQGYTCDPVETPTANSPHRLLIDGLLARGISTYRIEKPQAGDSRGGPACKDIDFATEMAGFETGYRRLVDTHGIEPDRIFLLGHSMGGIEAPLLAARQAPPRGVAVFGTVARNWHDYWLDIYRLQAFTWMGADPAEAERNFEAMRPIARSLLLERKTPLEIAAAGPEAAAALREMGWDGGERLLGRHHSFWQGLTAERLTGAWSKTRSNVLAVYGESDVAAINNADHRLIAEVVNHFRPGTARFVEVPRTGHGMTLDGSAAEVRARRQEAGNAPPPPFNPELVGLFADWIEASMREAPVASRFPAKG